MAGQLTDAGTAPEHTIAEEIETDRKLREAAAKAARKREASKLPAAGRIADALVANAVPPGYDWRTTLSEAKSAADADPVAARATLATGDEPLDLSGTAPRPAIPAHFAAATFASFDQSEHPSHVAAHLAALTFGRKAYRGHAAMLALIGPTGTGKSHLLYAVAHALFGAGRRVYCRPWYRLADELRYGGRSPFNEKALEAHEVRSLLWSQKIMLLDEVRPTAGTSFDDTELAKLACHAYDQGAALMITTNVHPLADVMGPPAASRFVQVVLGGDDRRQRRDAA